MQRLHFSDFRGGLNNVLAPHLIPKNQAVVYEKIDQQRGTIRPTKKHIALGVESPYTPVYFNTIIGTDKKIYTTNNLVSQWGKYFSKDLCYYTDNNAIVSTSYGLGARAASSFSTSQNDYSFANIVNLPGRVRLKVVDSTSVAVSDNVILSSGLASDTYSAWYSNKVVVYSTSGGIAKTGRMREVAHAKMPYIVGTTKYTFDDVISGYTAAPSSNYMKIEYKTINYTILYLKEGTKIDVMWIDALGQAIDINKAILENSMIVTGADNLTITTNYTENNVVSAIPFIYNGIKYTFSTTPPAGYTSAAELFDSQVLYDTTDTEETAYFTYAITLYNSKTGQETAPTMGSSTLIKPKALGAKVVVSFMPDPAGAYNNFTKARLYRVSGVYDTYRLVAELDYADTITYIDSKLDDSLGTAITTLDLVSKPLFNNIVGHANKLFGFIGNELWFNHTDSPHSWSNYSVIYVDGFISDCASVQNGLVILTSNNLAYLLTGTNNTTFTLRKISSNVGYSGGLVVVNSAAYWVYKGNIYATNGSTISNLTKDKYELPEETPVSIAVYNDDVYIAYTDNLYKFSLGTISTLGVAGITNLLVVGDKLYYFKDGNKYLMFASTAYATYKYVSPDIILSTVSARKEFEGVQVSYNGTATIRIFVDNEKAVEQVLSSSKIEVTKVQLPVNSNKGHVLRVEFDGSAEILEYVVIAQEVANGQ